MLSRRSRPSSRATIAIICVIIAVVLMALAVAIEVSAQSGDRDWKQAPTSLIATAGGAPGELDLSWDAHPQISKTLLDYRVTWTPDGESFKNPSQTEWYAYPTDNQATITGLDAGATYQVRIRARYSDGKKSRWSDIISATAADEEPEPTPDIARHHEEPPEIGVDDGFAFESDQMDFTVWLSHPTSHDVTFTWETSIEADDNAEANDFTSVDNGTGTIHAGRHGTTIYVSTTGDNFSHGDGVYEGDETFTINITDANNAARITSDHYLAQGLINDNISKPSISIIGSSASAIEGEDVVFNGFIVGQPTENDITFDYYTTIEADDNSESNDFTDINGTVTIVAGLASKQFSITVSTYDDGLDNSHSLYEGDETFTLVLENAVNVEISDTEFKGTIIDNESVPMVSFLDTDRSVYEDIGTLTNFIYFEIIPRSESSTEVSLTITGTATGEDDYLLPNLIVGIDPFQNGKGVPLTIINDDVYEHIETVIVQLVVRSGNIQIDPLAETATLTISDNDPEPVLSFADRNIIIDETVGMAVLTVNKTGLTEVTATVGYRTAESNTAVEGRDYVAVSGTLTFHPNESSKTIEIPIIDDNVYEDSDRFQVYLENFYDATLPSTSYYAAVNIISEDLVPTASMTNVTANERHGIMTMTLRLSHPSDAEISYSTLSGFLAGTADVDDDYEDFVQGGTRYVTIPARQLSKSFDIILIDDEVEEPDETIEITWQRPAGSTVNPEFLYFVGTITDPPVCDNLFNTIVVKNLRGEITQAGGTNLHKIRLDPYKSYLIEVIGQDGRDMLGVEEHSGLSLEDPEIFAIRNARGGSVLDKLATPNNKGYSDNAVAGFKKTEYKSYNIEVGSGNNGTGTYQFKIRLNNLCRLDENDNAHYNWFGGPNGYNPLEVAGDTSTHLSLPMGTDYGNYISRLESHAFLGNNWDRNPDEDWFAADLQQGEEYTVRLRTKTSLPERLQATQLKILGIKNANGTSIGGTSSGAAGRDVSVTDWEAPSTGRFYIAVGSEGSDRKGMYWIGITKRND